MPSFIYVFDKDARDKLLALRYEMIKSDEERQVFVFLNKERRHFAYKGIRYAMSDVLTF